MPEATPRVADFAHGRVPRAVRERQVLELAGELFAERGYRGASMDELARRAGVSKPVIYDLVGSKDDLFRACSSQAARQLAESVAAAVLGETEPAAKLRAGALAFFRFVAEHQRAWSVLFAGDAGPFAAHAAGIRRGQTQLVAELIADAAADMGTPVERTRIDAIANAINGASEALAHWWADHPELSPETLADWLVELVVPGLEGLARGPR